MQVVVERLAREADGEARLEAGLEVGAQRVAQQRGTGEGVAAVAGNVAEHEADVAVLELEDVVEVAAGARAVGRAVGHGRRERADPLGHLGQQRGLEQADLLGELAALAAEPPRPQCHGGPGSDGGEEERRHRPDRGLHRTGNHLDEVMHGPGDDGDPDPGECITGPS